MQIDLTAMAKRAGVRQPVTIRDIRPPSTLASNLYRTAYADVVEVWQVAAGLLANEYARTLSSLTTDAPTDLTSIIETAERRASSIYLLLTPALERWTLFVERWHRQKWTAAILSAVRVDLTTMLGANDVRTTLETAIANNVALVRSVSDEARTKMSQAVFEGLRNRTPARDVAKRLREVADMGRARSIRVAGDQLAKLTSSLADERRRQVGLSEWRWKHSGKRHPRENHRARDGKIYSDDPKMVGKTVKGQRIDAPPPPGDRPGQLPYCGCRSLSVLNI